jgi:AcrR family transcriptional regulator
MPTKKVKATRRSARVKPGADREKRQRLDPSLRRARILDEAAKLIARQGFLPIHMGELARGFSGSKALVYAYFPKPADLYNAVLGREVRELKARGLQSALLLSDLREAVELGGMLYFEHVMARGPLLRILMFDRYMQEFLEPSIVEDLTTVAQALTEKLQKHFALSSRSAAAACEMLSTIPEEAGALALSDGMDVEAMRLLCRRLLLSGLESFSALPSAGAELVDHAARTLDDRNSA